MERKSGVFLSISSLPSKDGIGTLGKSAYKFIDFLKESGFSYWQILPYNPTGFAVLSFHCLFMAISLSNILCSFFLLV